MGVVKESRTDRYRWSEEKEEGERMRSSTDPSPFLLGMRPSVMATVYMRAWSARIL